MVASRPPAAAPARRAASPFVAHCLELLAPLGTVRARAMFGGHGVYLDDLFFALIAADQLYLKVDTRSEPLFSAAGCEPFVYTGQGRPLRMSYWSVPAEAMDSPAAMLPWARLAVQAALTARAARSAARPSERGERRAPVRKSRR